MPCRAFFTRPHHAGVLRVEATIGSSITNTPGRATAQTLWPHAGVCRARGFQSGDSRLGQMKARDQFLRAGFDARVGHLKQLAGEAEKFPRESLS